jgi:hypothetical protein
VSGCDRLTTPEMSAVDHYVISVLGKGRGERLTIVSVPALLNSADNLPEGGLLPGPVHGALRGSAGGAWG